MKRALAIGFVMFAANAFAGAPAPAPAATAAPSPVTAKIESKSGSKLTGTVTFKQAGTQVLVQVDIQNAPAGIHAVHIHEKGDCSAADGASAGGHWNPAGEQHGQFNHDHFHLGDIGNITVGDDGKGSISLATDKWTLGGDAKSNVRGHAIIVHGGMDDFKTQPTGNAGNRIGCAVIPLK